MKASLLSATSDEHWGRHEEGVRLWLITQAKGRNVGAEEITRERSRLVDGRRFRKRAACCGPTWQQVGEATAAP